MIPTKADPRWRALIQSSALFPLKHLPTKMMLTRVRLIGSKKDEQSFREALDVAYEFFRKNEAAVRDDLHTIFGDSP